MKILVWGIGIHTKKILEENRFLLKYITAFIEKDRSKCNTTYLGRDVIPIDKITAYPHDFILVGTERYKDEILKILKQHFSFEKSFYIDDFLDNLNDFMSEFISCLPGEIERNRILNMALTTNQIPSERLQRTRVLSDRVEALHYMPKGGIVAEVGVAYGDFTKHILNQIKPQKMYAIDYYNGNNPGGDIWGRRDYENSGLTPLQWYEREFHAEISKGILETRQGMSWECLADFPDEYFDYVYLDACHSYDSVKRDVDVLRYKVKDGGMLVFNDYTYYNLYTDPKSAEGYYGVALVANEFINITKSEVLYLCLERCLSMDLVIKVNK